MTPYGKRNLRALGIFVVFYILFGTCLYVFQERVIYQPSPQDFTNCPSLPDAERVTYGETRMYVKESPEGMVVVYHGNAGSACDRKYLADLITQSGLGYILVEYSGYSNDNQVPTHDAIQRNVRDVTQYLSTHEYGNLAIIGESIGTGVASYHVSLREPKALLLISPFYDLIDVAEHRFWFYPASLLTKNAYTSGEWLKTRKLPITILHGDSDDLVPYSTGKRLYDALTSTDTRMITISGAGHNDLFVHEETYTAIRAFLEEFKDAVSAP